MDRVIVYPGAIPLETDILNGQKNAMIGLSKFIQAVIGDSVRVAGLACVPASPESLNVVVKPGEIYALQNIDNSAYSSLPADTARTIVKQGLMMDQKSFGTPAPGIGGQSINYLIQVAFQEADQDPFVLSYYNSANPTQAFSGPGNTGTSNNTVRRGLCDVTIKAGIAANTGTQTTPAADVGYVGLYVVTVTNGQTTVGVSHITKLASAPFIKGIDDVAQLNEDNNFSQPQTMLPATALGQAVIARQLLENSLLYGEDLAPTGTDDYAVNLPIPITAYKDGMTVYAKLGRANTSVCTLNVNSLGAKPIKRLYKSQVQDIFTDQILPNTITEFTYNTSDGGYWRITPPNLPGLFGDSTNTFDVAKGTSGANAIRRDQFLFLGADAQMTEALQVTGGPSTVGVVHTTDTRVAPCDGVLLAWALVTLNTTVSLGGVFDLFINGTQRNSTGAIANLLQNKTVMAASHVGAGAILDITSRITVNSSSLDGIVVTMYNFGLFIPGVQ